MRKLRLKLEALQVESFTVSTAATPGGTAHAYIDPDVRYPNPTEAGCEGDTGGSFDSWFGGCPTQGTCVGPTYCCPPSWRPSCSCMVPSECSGF